MNGRSARPDAFRSGSSERRDPAARWTESSGCVRCGIRPEIGLGAGLIDRSRAIRGRSDVSAAEIKLVSAARKRAVVEEMPGRSGIAADCNSATLAGADSRGRKYARQSIASRLAVETRRRESDVCDMARRKTLRRL